MIQSWLLEEVLSQSPFFSVVVVVAVVAVAVVALLSSCDGCVAVEVLFCQIFWTQACLEGIGTKGTHRSHARCHPYPIPQPVKVGHTTGVYNPYSFRTIVWVLLRPTRTDQ